MCNKAIISFGFCDIQNNRGKGYQVIEVKVISLSPLLINHTSTSIILDITKTSSNNCLKLCVSQKIFAQRQMT